MNIFHPSKLLRSRWTSRFSEMQYNKIDFQVRESLKLLGLKKHQGGVKLAIFLK